MTTSYLVRAGFLATGLFALIVRGLPAAAASDAAQQITPEQLAIVFPGADRVGPVSGKPPAAPAYKNDQLVGYVFSSRAVVGSVGYSGKPLDVLAGIDLDAVITGALLRQHDEPILVIGISEETLASYVRAFKRVPLAARVGAAPRAGIRLPDAIAGATISSAVIRDGILRAGRAVARSRGLLGGGPSGVRLDRESFSPANWTDLVGDGSIVHRRITQGEVAERFKGKQAKIGDAAPDALFIDLYLALITPPRIGENLLGKADFNRLTAEMGVDDQAVIIAAKGLYSFKGTGFIRSGRFDRIQIVQGENTIPLTRKAYRNVEKLRAPGAPEFREIGVFVVPATTGFDPLRPWRLDLLVSRVGAGDEVLQTMFSLEYVLPDRYRIGSPQSDAAEQPGAGTAPLWQNIWRARWGQIAGAITVLLVLTTLLVVQDAVARRARLHRRVRLAFLIVTLGWLGWYAGGQLSVVNVLTFVHSLMTGFRWQFFLLDPLIFLLWSYVAVAMLFWGRGVFCGWLCPFGALQELLSEGARKLNLPQLTLPFGLHERLWPLKYVIFLGLFAVSLNSIRLAFLGAEVEPFKTAISLKFFRDWPFVAYALSLLVAGLFIERFFCRYICPLGAALAIPARLRMFEWLKRRPQCGSECAICAQSCPVQAIHPSGSINPNECVYCLKCQTLYFDSTICPPLVAQRKRRERREALAAGHMVSMSKSSHGR